jgi:hypothetical protein
MAFQINASGNFQEGQWCIKQICLTIAFSFLIFPSLGKKQKL